jgi:hypothetical protein
MKTNNRQLSNPVPTWAYMTILTDTVFNQRIVRLVFSAILAGLTGVGCMDYVPTILAISKIILAYINFLIVIMHSMFIANDVTSAEICTLLSNANEQYTAAVKSYEQIVSRD